MRNFKAVACLATLLLAVELRGANALVLEGTLWSEVAQKAGVDPAVLVAIALQESGRKSGAAWTPSPHAVATPSGEVFAGSKDAARAVLARWRHDDRLDIGMMQVNLRHHRHRVASPEDLLEPTTNLRVAGDILAEALRSCRGDLWCGVGRYHSATPDRALRYATSVRAIYDALKTWQGGADADRAQLRR